jgi:sec-independent protein translocase protein TatA
MQDVLLMWALGPTEICLLLVVAILFFGPKRLPELGQSLGETLRSFRKASSNEDGQKSLKATPDE